MVWITFAVVFTLAALLGSYLVPRLTWSDDSRVGSAGTVAVWLSYLTIGLLGTLPASLHVVAAGEVGVVRTFGSITGQRGEGLQLTAPWQTLQKWDIKLRAVLPDSKCGDGEEKCLDSFSSESQDVFIRATVLLRVDAQDVQDLARTVGQQYDEKLVLPRLHQIVKDTTVQYRSVDIAPHREEIRQAIRERLARELAEASIAVEDVLLTNIDFRPDFKAAIEAKVAAEQNALAEQNKVAISEAQARQRAAVAQGIANALRIEAEGQAAANRLINESLTPLLVQFQAVQKLAGNVTLAFLPSGVGLLLDPATWLTPAR